MSLSLIQAHIYYEKYLSNCNPIICQDDELVTLNWSTQKQGVSLAFEGDDKVSCSIKTAGGYYTKYENEQPITKQLPENVVRIIQSIER